MPYLPARYPKDIASTLMTVACVEAVLHHDQAPTTHAWEARHYGVKTRSFDSGPKTRGTMQRNRTGEVVVSFARAAEWEEGRPSVREIRSSPLWALLRQPRVLTPEEWLAVEPMCWLATHMTDWLFPAPVRRSVDETMLRHLAACGTFDAIAVLWTLHQEALAQGRRTFAFACARYVIPAVGILASTPVGVRVALPLFGLLRQRYLDDARSNGQRLSLNGCDVPAMRASAMRLSRLEAERKILGSRNSQSVAWPLQRSNLIGCRLIVSADRTGWVEANLPATVSSRGAGRRRIWQPNLSPLSHPLGPCHADFRPAYHARTLTRIRDALGAYA